MPNYPLLRAHIQEQLKDGSKTPAWILDFYARRAHLRVEEVNAHLDQTGECLRVSFRVHILKLGFRI
jgi:hypothetical protein